MSNKIFANGREVACKAGAGKTICAFPDVCFTPPQTPATPPGVPIPYPNTGMASDMAKGTKKVKISGKEIGIKNKSYFKKSTGDEAGSAPKKGVVTSKNMGKVYFTCWSMDVKFEGENAVRHLDPTTNNHGCALGDTPPFPFIDCSAFATAADCAEDKDKMEKACAGQDPCPGFLKLKVGKQRKKVKATAGMSRTTIVGNRATKEADGNECVKKSRCYLRPYKPTKRGKKDGCCPGQTPHHIPPKQCLAKVKGYKKDQALCVCMEGANQHTGSHGKNHAAIEHLAKSKNLKIGAPYNLAEYNKMCAMAVEAQCGCKKECIEAQLNQDFKEKKINPATTNVKHVTTNSSASLGLLEETLNKAYKAAIKVPLKKRK